MRFNQYRFNGGRFSGGRVYDPAPIVYLIYAGDSAAGPVDYSHAIRQTRNLSIALDPLAHSTSTRFGVRTHSNVTGLTESNTDAQVIIVVGSGGEDLTSVPLAPSSLSVRPGPGGTAVVEWSYPYLALADLPTGFHVYLSPAPSLSYATPAATVPYGPSLLPVAFRRAQPGIYRATLAGLDDGASYVVGVRAYGEHGEETNTVTATVVGDTTPPANVANLVAVNSTA